MVVVEAVARLGIDGLDVPFVAYLICHLLLLAIGPLQIVRVNYTRKRENAEKVRTVESVQRMRYLLRMLRDDTPRAADPKTVLNRTVTLAMMWKIELYARMGHSEGHIAHLLNIDRAALRELINRNRLLVRR